MKDIKEYLNINEAEFCKPNDICYKVLNKEGKQVCIYLPYTGFGEGDELENKALEMAKSHNGKVIKLYFKDFIPISFCC